MILKGVYFALGVSLTTVAALFVAGAHDALPVQPSAPSVPTASATPVPTPDVRPTPRKHAERIAISRLGIDLPVVSGGQVDNLPDGVALHMPGTALPCEDGTSFVYSHARVGMFLPLWNVLPGDTVVFTRLVLAAPHTVVYDDVCSYTVVWSKRVAANDTSWYTWRGAERTLILQTSLGPNPSYGEFIVYAEGKKGRTN